MAGPKVVHIVYAVSFALHVVGALVLDAIEVPKTVEAVAVEMQTIEQPKEEKPKPVEPTPVPAPKAAPHRSAPPPPAPVAAPVAPPAPDFGFVMGAGGGPGGIAIPTGPPPAPVAKAPPAHKILAAAAAPEGGCEDAEVKPKATSMPHPAYTDEARAAAIEGKVRVELSIDANGQVTDARVIEGLGSGLDEAAVAALRGATFSPATKCGKPVATTFVVAIRFAL
jgi:protein TonB